MGNKDLLFRLFYGTTSGGVEDGTAMDINALMQEMGLVKETHYDLFPMMAIFQDGSFGMEIYNLSEGVGLSVLKGKSNLYLPNAPLAIFGYHAVADYLKKNKKIIKGILKE